LLEIFAILATFCSNPHHFEPRPPPFVPSFFIRVIGVHLRPVSSLLPPFVK